MAGRNTYEDSDGFGGGSPHPTARLFVLSHRPAPEMSERQTLVTTGIAGRGRGGSRGRRRQGRRPHGRRRRDRGAEGGLVDEVVLHQVPILLGGGRPFFQALPGQVRLRLVEAVPAPGVTHLHYEVER